MIEIMESYNIKPRAFNELVKPELKRISKKNGQKIRSIFKNYIESVENYEIKSVTNKIDYLIEIKYVEGLKLGNSL